MLIKNKSEQTLVKPPNKKQIFSAQELDEFQKCADPITGPEYFMRNFFNIQHPTKGKLLYSPYSYQIDLIDTYHNNRYAIALMPRQTGKTTSAAGYLLWYAMFIPDATILIAAHIGKGSQEIMQRIRYAYETCPDHIRAGAVTYNKGNIDFDNGSRIVSTTTTETTGRGMSISLLYLDEFAFVRPTIASIFWSAISPTLATGGKCIITSTPNSDEDQFSLLWKGANKCEDEYGNPTKLGVNGFKAFRSYWWDHPDRDDKWGAEMKAQLGEDKFAREILCEFIIADETLISGQKLQLLESRDSVFRQGQIRWFKTPVKGNIHVVALDPAIGTGGDSAAIQVFDANTCEQIAEWKHNKTPIPEQVKLIAEICQYIESITKKPTEIYYSVENNSVGEAAIISIAQYGEEKISGYFLSEPGLKKRKGFGTTNKTKLTACSKLKNMLENDRLKINSSALISELKTYVSSGGSYEAKLGSSDDLVAATLIAVRMMVVLQNYHPDIDTTMRDFSADIIAPMPFMVGLTSWR
jgi:hypothetical protein